MDATKVMYGAIAIIIGVILIPLVAMYVVEANTGRLMVPTGGDGLGEEYYNTTPVANISGLTSVTQLVAYGFSFGIVGLGVGMVYIGFKKK